jgi:hypothetical protein
VLLTRERRYRNTTKIDSSTSRIPSIIISVPKPTMVVKKRKIEVEVSKEKSVSEWVDSFLSLEKLESAVSIIESCAERAVNTTNIIDMNFDNIYDAIERLEKFDKESDSDYFIKCAISSFQGARLGNAVNQRRNQIGIETVTYLQTIVPPEILEKLDTKARNKLHRRINKYRFWGELCSLIGYQCCFIKRKEGRSKTLIAEFGSKHRPDVLAALSKKKMEIEPKYLYDLGRILSSANLRAVDTVLTNMIEQ